MFTPMNPQNEERRAQAMLGTLTDHNQAVEAFGPKRLQHKQVRAQVETTESTAEANTEASRNDAPAITRVFQAIKNSRPVIDEPVQPVCSSVIS